MNEFGQRSSKGICLPELKQFFDRITVLPYYLKGHVHAVLLKVDRDILPEVRKLQRCARIVRKALPLGVGVAAKIQDESADRICRITAVSQQIIPGVVSRHGLVLHKRSNQI